MATLMYTTALNNLYTLLLVFGIGKHSYKVEESGPN